MAWSRHPWFGDDSRFYPLQAGFSGDISNTVGVLEIMGFDRNWEKHRQRQGVDAGLNALLTD